MNLEIVKPDASLFSGEVKSVHLPGSDGSFEILNSHAPLIATLTNGVVRIVKDNSESQTFDVKGGVVEVNNNKVIVLAE